MSVSPGYRAYVLEQLSLVRPVTARAMFGGLGIYAEGMMFALVDDDVLYLKTDDRTRPDFEAEGMGPFRPFDGAAAMGYHELPGELLEDPEALAPWVDKALGVAMRAKGKKKPTTKGTKKG